MGSSGIVSIEIPKDPVFRVGRASNLFEPPSWVYAIKDKKDMLYGTFGNRFDDPGGKWGVPEEQRFRTVYFCSQAAGAFGETIARFRASISLIAGLGEIDDDQPLDLDLYGGIVPADWRLVRRLGVARLGEGNCGDEGDQGELLKFADLEAPETVQALRAAPELAEAADKLGIPDIDYSAINGPRRVFTQLAARYIYRITDVENGNKPIYAGLRYTSRLNPSWECWAVFHDRLAPKPLLTASIHADHPGLCEAALLLGLEIEVFPGVYLSPKEVAGKL